MQMFILVFGFCHSSSLSLEVPKVYSEHVKRASLHVQHHHGVLFRHSSPCATSGCEHPTLHGRQHMFVHHLACTHPTSSFPLRSREVLTFDGDTGPRWVPSDTSTRRLLMLSQIYTDLSVSQNVPPFPTGRVQPFITSYAHFLIRVSLYIGGSRPPLLPFNLPSRTTGSLDESGSAYFSWL
jgi:hypothetical protein